MSKVIIQIDELIENMSSAKYLNINLSTGEYIPVPAISFREDDLKDLIPAPESGFENFYRDPKASRSMTWVCRQVPDIYFQKGVWYDLPIPYTIYEPVIHFREDDLKNLIPAPESGYKNTYRESKTGTYYDIPDYYFQKNAFADLILVPHYSEDTTRIKIKFLDKVIKQRLADEPMIQEINRLFTLTDDPGYFAHEFDLLLGDNKLYEEWRSFANEEENTIHEQVKNFAIQWCEKIGLEYLLNQ
ncbi:MAG: hypothetical protein FWC25_02850 [Dehalococcoidia bacterium]|nr:hypothetical protein [Dehalococcoidia bacterium]